MVPFMPSGFSGGGGGCRATGFAVGRLAVSRGLAVGRGFGFGGTVGHLTVGRLTVGRSLTVGFLVGSRFAVGRFFVGFRLEVGRFFVGFHLVDKPPRLWQPNTLT